MRPLVVSYAQDLRSFPDTWHKIGLWLLGVIALTYPFAADAYWLTIANLALTSIVGSVALMILTGLAGQISLGHAAFLALGAYTAAVLSSRFGLPFWLVLPAAGLVAASVGMLVGPFALRLSGLYLAIVTLGLLFVVQHVLLTLPALTGGVAGIAVPVHAWFGEPGATLTPFSETSVIAGIEITFERKLYAVYLALAALATLVLSHLHRSPAGRAMMAVRDHDLAAAVMGVNPARVKIAAFALSSFVAGVAGAMFAFQQKLITVDPPFNLEMSIQYVAMIVLGGLGTPFGAVVGALAYVFLAPLAELVGRQVPFLSELSSAQQSIFLFALAVGAFLVLEPLGLYGIWLRVKRYFSTWPFSY